MLSSEAEVARQGEKMRLYIQSTSKSDGKESGIQWTWKTWKGCTDVYCTTFRSFATIVFLDWLTCFARRVFQGSSRWTGVREGLTKPLEHQSASTRHGISVQCISSKLFKLVHESLTAFIEPAAFGGGSFNTCSAKECQTEDNGTTQIKVQCCNLAQDLCFSVTVTPAMPPVFSY